MINNLLSYTLSVAPAGTGDFETIATVDDGVSITGDVLGLFDPTMLPNGSYTLRLTALDAGGKTASDSVLLTVSGNLKLGNFTLSFVDLQIPVAGIPITITRSYDTLDANKRGDFGYGWSLGYEKVTVDVNDETLGGSSGAALRPFLSGTSRVYVTLPDGTREGFTFVALPQAQFTIVTHYLPYFVPDEGNTSQLIVDQVPLTDLQNGTFQSDAGAYNPYYHDGFTVRTADGYEYTVDAATGEMSAVSDRYGNTLTFEHHGIFSNRGRSVTFTRDFRGCITSVTDPRGYSVDYEYDSAGDLVAVTDRNEFTTQFVYDAPKDHYLTQIFDPLGRAESALSYDEDGRVVQHLDVQGQAIGFNYEVPNKKQTITDQLNNDTEVYYDALGSVTKTVDAMGHITLFNYAPATSNLISTTKVVGEIDSPANGELDDATTTFGLDQSGDILSVTGASGQTSYFTYNEFGQLESTTTYFPHNSHSNYRSADGRGGAAG